MTWGWNELITRRRALARAGGLGLAAFLPACGDADEPTATGPASGSRTGGGAGADCVLSPELSEGPFYLDVELVRADITEGKEGAPLELAVTVVDADSCAPIADAAVDVWHCDAGGTYSGVQGADGTFLRGIQITDGEGRAGFSTIFPGWYSGRAVHIHVKVHLGSDSTFTGQLFFHEADTAEVYETDPYAARPGPDVPNAADAIFAQGGDSTTVVLRRTRDGYAGTVTLGIRRA